MKHSQKGFIDLGDWFFPLLGALALVGITAIIYGLYWLLTNVNITVGVG